MLCNDVVVLCSKSVSAVSMLVHVAPVSYRSGDDWEDATLRHLRTLIRDYCRALVEMTWLSPLAHEP